MIRNILIAILATATVVMAGVLVFNARRPAPQPPATLVVTNDNRVVVLEGRLADQQRELKQLRLLLEAEQKKVADLKARAAATSAKPAEAKPFANLTANADTNNPLGKIMQAVSGILTNPAAMKSMTQGFRTGMRLRDRLYADFITKTGLTPEQAREFRRLVQRKRMAMMGRGWMGADSEEQMKETDASLKSLLGSNYDAYLAYENQMPARTFAESFALSLEDQGKPMSVATKTSLINALAGIPGMSATEQQQSFQASFQPGQPVDPEKMVNQQLDQTMGHYDQIVAAAKPVLSVDENAALDAYLGQQMQQQEMGANVARVVLPAIFGTNGVPPAVFGTGSGISATGAVSVQVITLPER